MAKGASAAEAKQALLQTMSAADAMSLPDKGAEAEEKPFVNTLVNAVSNTREVAASSTTRARVSASDKNSGVSDGDGGATDFPWLFLALMAMLAFQLLQVGKKALGRHLRISGMADRTNVFQQLDRVGLEKRKRSLGGDEDEYAGLEDDAVHAGRRAGGRGGHLLNDSCDYRDQAEPRTRLMAF
jgi:hypothetical protein